MVTEQTSLHPSSRDSLFSNNVENKNKFTSPSFSWFKTRMIAKPSLLLTVVATLVLSLILMQFPSLSEALPASQQTRSRRTTPYPSFNNPYSPVGRNSSQDVLFELQHCSAKSTKDVNNCYKTYESDVSQFGRRGEPCCSYVKFVKCLNDTLILPCIKYVDPLVKLYIKEKPKHCEEITYPSISCLVIVNTNIIIGVSIFILTVTVCCGLIHVCRCLCRCFKNCCGKFRRDSSWIYDGVIAL